MKRLSSFLLAFTVIGLFFYLGYAVAMDDVDIEAICKKQQVMSNEACKLEGTR